MRPHRCLVLSSIPPLLVLFLRPAPILLGHLYANRLHQLLDCHHDSFVDRHTGCTCDHLDNPASITYGTALSTTQLNAIASVPGTLVYTLPRVPSRCRDGHSVGHLYSDRYHQLFDGHEDRTSDHYPGHSGDYLGSTGCITYGTALSTTQLNATASVPGTLVYTPAAGTSWLLARHPVGHVYPDRHDRLHQHHQDGSVSPSIKPARDYLEYSC